MRSFMQSRIAGVTAWARPPLVPELKLRLVTAASPWWTTTPEALAAEGIPEPFWGFAWAGGQSLARYILDHPETVRGKSVLDFGTGGGVVALAALAAGAAFITATEIDPWAIVACEMNLEGLEGDTRRPSGQGEERSWRERVALSEADWIGRALEPGTVVLCGDMSYERELCEKLMDWFATLERSCSIIIGDPGRGWVDHSKFELLREYLAPADSDSEGIYKVRASVLRYTHG